MKNTIVRFVGVFEVAKEKVPVGRSILGTLAASPLKKFRQIYHIVSVMDYICVIFILFYYRFCFVTFRYELPYLLCFVGYNCTISKGKSKWLIIAVKVPRSISIDTLWIKRSDPSRLT